MSRRVLPLALLFFLQSSLVAWGAPAPHRPSDILFRSGLLAPLLGLVLLGAVGTVVVLWYLRSIDRSTRKAIPTASSSAHVLHSLDELTVLKIHDIGFTTDDFLEDVRERLLRINEALSQGRLEPARRLVGDSLYLRFQAEKALHARRGTRTVRTDWHFEDLFLFAVDGDGEWETIHIRVTAQMREVQVPFDLPHEEARQRAMAASPQRVVEVWSLSRQAGTKTVRDGGALVGKCPACFVPLPPNHAVRCDNCKVLCNGATHDWVVSNIRPQDRFQAWIRRDPLPNLATLKQQDPGLSRERIRDQAVLLFWRWIEARILGEPTRLRRHVLAPLPELKVHEGQAEPLDQVWLGMVEVVACVPGAAGGNEARDRCYVRVHWSAAREMDGVPIPLRQIFVLGRRVGAKTYPGRASLVCRQCYTMLDGETGDKCSCGAAIGPGDQDWALEAVLSPPAAERLRATHAQAAGITMVPAEDLEVPRLSDPRERELLVGTMARLLAANGELPSRERKILERCAFVWSIPRDRTERLLKATHHQGVSPLEGDERISLLDGLVATVLLDDRVMVEEQALLDLIGSRLDFPPAAVAELIGRAHHKRPGPPSLSLPTA
ncbi:MAG TPA: TIM44-like domain-containing protein [Polyangia bacterium]|nr:TIM44-like domain-containing protein [Polyangia bacterium]